MAGLTYKQQLLHPNWQRRRLQILERDGFACVACGSGDKTLHVHHKRYVRGRMAWDYEDDDLSSLCQDCHSIVHDSKELLDHEISRVEVGEGPIVHALLIGFRGGLVATEGVPPEYADSKLCPGEEVSRTYWIGQIARILSNNLTKKEVGDLWYALNSRDVSAVVAAAKADGDRQVDEAMERLKDKPLDEGDIIV